MLGLYIKDNSKLPVTNNIPFGVEIFYVNIDKIHIANLCNENEKKSNCNCRIPSFHSFSF